MCCSYQLIKQGCYLCRALRMSWYLIVSLVYILLTTWRGASFHVHVSRPYILFGEVFV